MRTFCRLPDFPEGSVAATAGLLMDVHRPRVPLRARLALTSRGEEAASDLKELLRAGGARSSLLRVPLCCTPTFPQRGFSNTTADPQLRMVARELADRAGTTSTTVAGCDLQQRFLPLDVPPQRRHLPGEGLPLRS